jgi:hypothetical protein
VCLTALHDFEEKPRIEDHFEKEWGNWRGIRLRADGDCCLENSVCQLDDESLKFESKLGAMSQKKMSANNSDASIKSPLKAPTGAAFCRLWLL